MVNKDVYESDKFLFHGAIMNDRNERKEPFIGWPHDMGSF